MKEYLKNFIMDSLRNEAPQGVSCDAPTGVYDGFRHRRTPLALEHPLCDILGFKFISISNYCFDIISAVRVYFLVFAYLKDCILYSVKTAVCSFVPNRFINLLFGEGHPGLNTAYKAHQILLQTSQCLFAFTFTLCSDKLTHIRAEGSLITEILPGINTIKAQLLQQQRHIFKPARAA